MEFTSRPAQVLSGSCTGCGHSFTMLEGAVELGRTARGISAGTPGPNEPSGEGVSSSGPACTLCGATLEVAASPRGLTGVCKGCSSSFQFILQSGDEGPDRRPLNRTEYRRHDREPSEGPRTRPCRNCGGPLQFTTSPEGLVTGTCAACGNRFTLPPRRDQGARGRGGSPTQTRGYLPRRGSTSGWQRKRDWGAPPPGFRPRAPPPQRRNRREDRDEVEWTRKSRRRRTAE